MTLKLAHKLQLPNDAVTQTFLILGKRGTMLGVRPVPRIKLRCETCGTDFTRMECEISRQGEGRFCSRACMYAWRSHQVEIVCFGCGKSFMRKRSEIAKKNYCDRHCYNDHRPPTKYRKKGARHEHRIVAEQKLGRPLRPGEIVHHRDDDGLNNEPTNLEVLPDQATHIRLHKPRLGTGKR